MLQGSRYKLTYDGMYHLDIPKTRQYDHGKVEVIARSSVGESRTETFLTVKQRSDDYRGVLKNSPRRKLSSKWKHSYKYAKLHSLSYQYIYENSILFFSTIIIIVCPRRLSTKSASNKLNNT